MTTDRRIATPIYAAGQVDPVKAISTEQSESQCDRPVPAAPEPYWKTMCGEESNGQAGLKMPGVGGIACGLNKGHSGRHSWEYSFEELQGTTAAPTTAHSPDMNDPSSKYYNAAARAPASTLPLSAEEIANWVCGKGYTPDATEIADQLLRAIELERAHDEWKRRAEQAIETNQSLKRENAELKQRARIWLGVYRDKLPAAAVSELQDILGVPK